MKKVGDLFKELGFKDEAPDGVKEAFIKHLIKASTGQIVETPSERKAVNSATDKVKKITQFSEQLSFDFTAAEKKQVG